MRPFQIHPLAAALLALSAGDALAKGSELDPGTRVIPYNGVLEQNGASFNGSVDMKFTLTDTATCTMSEEHKPVTVTGGRFSVNLGSVAGDIPACIFNASAVYITIGVKATSATSYSTLSGRQRIYPVPFSYWSAEGSNFQIDGTAAVGSSLTVGTTATVGTNLTVNGTSTLKGNTAVTGTFSASGYTYIGGRMGVAGSDFVLGTNDGRTTGTNSAQLALVHSDTDALIVNYGGSFEGGTTVASNLTVTGNVTANGNLTAANFAGLGTSGSATTVARSDHGHSSSCKSGTLANFTSNGSRLCVYKWESGSSPNWITAANACWTNYGAELCTVNQLRLACSFGSMGISTNYYLRDRPGDDEAIYTNQTGCDNFDGLKTATTGLNGGYCCVVKQDL